MDLELDIEADLNAQDDDGLGWSTLADATDPSASRPGAMLLAGNRFRRAGVRVVAVDDDRHVHFTSCRDRWRRTATCWAGPSPSTARRTTNSTAHA